MDGIGAYCIQTAPIMPTSTLRVALLHQLAMELRFRMVLLSLSFLLAALLLAACMSPQAVSESPPENGPTSAVYLVAHGWHTGIVVRRADIPPGLWPESRDFGFAEYIEVGWGDRDFYQKRDPGVWTTLRAAFLPTSSVLHVVGFPGPVERYFPASEVVGLTVRGEGFGVDSAGPAHGRTAGSRGDLEGRPDVTRARVRQSPQPARPMRRRQRMPTSPRALVRSAERCLRLVVLRPAADPRRSALSPIQQCAAPRREASP